MRLLMRAQKMKAWGHVSTKSICSLFPVCWEGLVNTTAATQTFALKGLIWLQELWLLPIAVWAMLAPETVKSSAIPVYAHLARAES